MTFFSRCGVRLSVRVASAALVAAAVSAQAPVFNPANGASYVLLSSPMTASAARTAAAGMGGTLVAFADAAEMNFVYAAFMNQTSVNAIWIGLSDSANEGTFVWDDGTSLSFSAWSNGQPDDAGGVEDDVELVKTSITSPPLAPIYVPTWNDLSSSAARSVVVELPPAGDAPAAAVVVNADGVYGYDSTLGVAAGPAASCSAIPGGDVFDYWFRYDATVSGMLVVGNCPGSARAPGGNDASLTGTYIAAWTGAPTNLMQLSCRDSSVDCVFSQTEIEFAVTAGQSYYLQVGTWITSVPVVGAMAFKLAAPGDDCAGAYELVHGGNGFFTNAGAGSGSAPACASAAADVWFKYDAPAAGRTTVTVSAATPGGAAGLTAPLVQLFDACGGAPLACVVGTPNVPSVASSGAYVPRTVYVRVAGGPGAASGTGYFQINVAHEPFRIELSSPAGPGTVRVRNVGGVSGAFYLSLFTLNEGAFPNGPFGGLSASPLEVFNQIALNGPPCFGVLNASGESTFGPVGGAPPVTIYATTFQLDAAGYVALVAPPVAYSIP